MSKTAYIFSLVVVSVLVLTGPVLAQSNRVVLVISDLKQVSVGAIFEEGITVQNNGASELAPGVLKIILPAHLRLEAYDPASAARSGQTVVYNIPAIAAGKFHKITYAVSVIQAGTDIKTNAVYEVAGTVLAQASYSKNLLGGSLPQTGMNPGVLFVLFSFVSFLFAFSFSDRLR